MFKKRITLKWLSMAAMIALIAILIVTAPVFAQDEAPAEPTPEENPVEEAPTEEIPAEELPALEEVTEGVEIVPTNAEGEALPLASQEAAEVLADGDPWWKVGTITYRFKFPGQCGGEPYCLEDPNPIAASITYIMINATAVPTDGKIYVEAGTYFDPSISINGSNANLAKLKGTRGRTIFDQLSTGGQYFEQ